MTKENLGIGIAVVALILATGSFLFPRSQSIDLGAAYRLPNSDLSAKTITSNGAFTSTGDATVSGGTLTVTTSNTATSTVTAGCFQFYATSTATAQKFQASTTPGIMYSQFGSCPGL